MTGIVTEMEINELEMVNGGTVNKNPDPGKLDNGIDGILNGKTYDRIAQMIADRLNGDDVRKRKVDNSQDINDYEI